MLISITEATRRYSIDGDTIAQALNRGKLTRHETTSGKVNVDTDELDQLFAAAPRPSRPQPPAPSPPAERPDASWLPTPDELDAALKRALGMQ